MSQIERKEILINKVVGREDQPQDWHELRDLADADPSADTGPDLWQRVLNDMESESGVRAAGAACLEAAQSVALPLPTQGIAWRRSALAWISPLGWVAALVIASLWIATSDRRSIVSAGEPIPLVSEGDFVTELPRILVSSVPNESGDAFELMYMRRFLERVQVDELLRMRRDEAGQTFATAVSPADYRPTRSY